MSKQAEAEKNEQTDSQKFQDAMHAILAAPSKEVKAQLAAEKPETSCQSC